MANKEYKSDVFSMLLQDKKRAMEIYNAINGTDYDDPELVEMTTLDDKSFSLTVRNDASFILDANLSLYEHQSRGICGGHIILLNAKDSPYYEKTKNQALAALRAYPGGLQVGGGITDANASEFLEAGASAVIVTSFVFRDGRIDYDCLNRLEQAVGKEHLVLDLSCRYRADAEEPGYYIVTDRWQKFTTERVTNELLEKLSSRCSEFLVHAVDVEGKSGGIEKPLAQFLGDWGKIPITYAGGVHSFKDLEEISQLGRNRLNVTIGSALDLFGGPMSYEQVLTYISKCNAEKEKSI